MNSSVKTTKDQRDYLAGRMLEAEQSALKRLAQIRSPTKPAAILKAEKLVAEWEEDAYKKSEEYEASVREKLRHQKMLMRERLNFGTPEEALAAVRKFEAWAKEFKI